MTIFNPPRDEQGHIIVEAEEPPAAPVPTEAATPSTQETPARTMPTSPEQRPMSELLGTPPQQLISRRTIVGTTIAVVFVGVCLVVFLMALQTAPRSTSTPTAPTTVPAVTAAPIFTRAVVAWSAPDGEVLGALERGQPYTFAARSGEGWYQLQVGSGLVWVRAGDLGENPAGQVPNLATPVPSSTPLPPVPPESDIVACDQYSAPWHIMREVQDQRGIPIGSITAWSCVSRADAEDNAAVQEEQLRASVQATQEADR